MDNMRQKPRVEINHIIGYAHYQPGNEDDPLSQGLLINLSTMGALIETKEPVTLGPLVLSNNSETSPKAIVGRAIYNNTIISEEETYGKYRTGITFIDSPPKIKDFVVSIITPEKAGNISESVIVLPTTNNGYSHFDIESINSILAGKEETEPQISLDFMNDDDTDSDIDVLDSIADILHGTEQQIHKPVVFTAKKTEEPPEEISEPEYINVSYKTPLYYINAVCICLICLMIIPAVYFIKKPIFKKDALALYPGAVIEIPFLEPAGKPLPDVFSKASLRQPEMITLVKNSLKGQHFINDNEKAFVVSGFISTSPSVLPTDIRITGRVFNQEGIIVKKSYGTPEEQTFLINKSGTRQKEENSQKLFPFHIAFSNLTDQVTQYSIDLE